MNLEAMGMFVLFYFMIFGSIFWLMIYYEKKDNVKKDPKPKRFPLVSIVIPVYYLNTKEDIKRSVISCLSVDYPKKEIILAWNGKINKEVWDVCKEYEKRDLVKLVKTEKQGKAAAINHALKTLKGEYFCCLDGDSFFQRDALKHMVGYLENPNVGAVTTSMKAFKPKTWIERLQWVEYIFAIYLRRLMSMINSQYVVPGPGGMYKTKIAKEIGGFDENILTEDMEITFRIMKAGYEIRNGINAYVDTNVPKTFWELVKQRIRWYAGFIDTLKKHRKFMLNPKYGTLGMYVIPSSLLWVAVLFISLGLTGRQIGRWIGPAIKSYFLVGIDWTIINKWIEGIFKIQPNYIMWFGSVFFVISLIVVYLGLKLSSEGIDIKKKFPNYFMYMFAYTFILSVFWIFTIGYLIIRNRKNKDLIKW